MNGLRKLSCSADFCRIFGDVFFMTEEVKRRLRELAGKYENSAFLQSDPSQFLRWYKNQADVEIASFVAAMLSFGNRKQFIPKIRFIFETADKGGGIFLWIKSGAFEKDFCSFSGDDEKFYRFYSYDEMKNLFRAFKILLEKYETFGEYIKNFDSGKNPAGAISAAFENCKIVPKGKNSANKRVNMFLRWMVRQDSPVDLGLWSWISPADLIIPLDTHVIQEAVKLGLIPENSPASMRTAQKITAALKEIWPCDPCKGDFALFGLGVDEDK